MKIQDSIKWFASGRRNNTIYYIRGGKMYARRYAIPGKKRKWETEGRSPKQKEVTTRFSAVQAFYKEFCKQVSPEPWRATAKRQGKMASNIFMAKNYQYFSVDGEIADFEAFLFTDGTLVLPREIRVAREGKYFTVTWQEERNTVTHTDIMHVGLLYDNLTLSPRLALETQGQREELRGKFALDESLGQAAHAYIFFGNTEETEFSSSRHLHVEIENL